MIMGATSGGSLRECMRAARDGVPPVCTEQPGGGWEPSYPGYDTMGTGIPSGFGVLVLLVLLGGIAITVWRVSTARRMARDAGMDERDAGTMALVSDDGFEATYLAASLRQPPPTAPATTEPAAPVPRAAADRLRELDELLEQGLIDEQEHAATRQAILGSL